MKGARWILVMIVVLAFTCTGGFAFRTDAHLQTGQNEPPHARFVFSPPRPTVGQPVRFDASYSFDSDGTITNYIWDFGDGWTGYSGKTTTHTYGVSGTYTVTLSVRDNDGAAASTSKTITVVEVGENEPPRARFTYSPAKPTVGQAVTFDASASYDPDGTITSYVWDYGDGWIGHPGRVITHIYNRSGTYNVTLTVRDNDGATISTAKRITVVEEQENKAPRASFSFSPAEPTDLDLVHFTDQSTDPDGEIASWSWDFGDGDYSTERSPEHRYEDNGTYDVTLTVQDNLGATDSISREIVVLNVPPKGGFTFSPSGPIIGAPVIFDASDSGDPDGIIMKYEWDFEDGATGEGQKITHTFTSEAGFQVKLTVTDDDGATDSLTKEVRVTAPEEKLEDRYAIVIGISDYLHATEETCPGFCDLKYPAADAQEFYNLLVDERIGSFPREHVALLIDDQATVGAIKGAFAQLIAQAEEQDLVTIYYSGHGGQGPDLNGDDGDGTDEYYIAYDTKPTKADELFATGIRDDEFGDWMQSLRSRHVVILLDSCFSGGATKAIRGTSPSGYKAGPNNSVFNDFSIEARVLVSASQENEFSFESDGLGHGVFTYFLLEALQGEGDADRDGRIIADEVYEYVRPRVKEYVASHWPGYSQIPLRKGTISPVVVPRQEAIEGEITAIEGDKEQAELGDKVLISLGGRDGVQIGNIFEVYREFSSKGVVIEEVRGKIEVTDVVAEDRSLCEVIESKFPIKAGDKVRRTQGR